MLGPMETAVPNEKKEKADDEAGANLCPCGAKALCQAPEEKNGAGGKMTEAGSVKRRDGFNGVTNGEIGGTPDQIDGEKSKNDGGAIQMRPRWGNRSGKAGNNCS